MNIEFLLILNVNQLFQNNYRIMKKKNTFLSFMDYTYVSGRMKYRAATWLFLKRTPIVCISFCLTGSINLSGVSSLGVPAVPWHPQILAEQLNLSQPGGKIMPTTVL